MKDTPKGKRTGLLASYVLERLKRRHFEAYYCETAEQALAKASELIPDGSSVSWGGSTTIRDMGLTKLMHERDLEVIDRDLGENPQAVAELHRKGLLADYFLVSANAMTDDGVLVNVDANGNRVAAIAFGPRNVIVICGMNKVTPDLDAAVSRARGYVAPINSMRFMGDTPCAKTGKCHNCTSPQSICTEVLVTRLSKPAGRIKVILVGEDMGF